jgi:hypothetical protein
MRFFGALDPEYEGGPQDLEALVRGIEAVADRLAEERRREPKDDMLSQLVSAEVDGQKLSNTEIGGFFRLLLGAGHDTTKNLLEPVPQGAQSSIQPRLRSTRPAWPAGCKLRTFAKRKALLCV